MLRKTSEGKKYTMRDYLAYKKYLSILDEVYEPLECGFHTAMSLKNVSAFELSMLEAEAMSAVESEEKFKKFLDKIKRLGGTIVDKDSPYKEIAEEPLLRARFAQGFIDRIQFVISEGQLKAFKLMRW
jgi:hypothetical protein